MDYSYVQFSLCGITTIVDCWNIGCCHPEIDVGLSESVKEKKNDDDDLTFIKTTMFLSFSHLARTTVTDGITEQKSPIRWRLRFFTNLSRGQPSDGVNIDHQMIQERGRGLFFGTNCFHIYIDHCFSFRLQSSNLCFVKM
jgi:hypothetical protein